MTPSHPDPPIRIDTLGTFCPVPIIKTAEAMRNLDSGGLVEVTSDDPAIEHDMPAWCKSTGNTIESMSVKDGIYIYRVRKNAS